MTTSPEFDALLATTQLEREKADGIKSLIAASKLAADYQHRAEVAEAALARVEDAAVAIHSIMLKHTQDHIAGSRIAYAYAGAYQTAERLINDARATSC